MAALSKTRVVPAFVAGAAIVGLMPLAHGQGGAQDEAPVVTAMEDCRNVADAATRLACYDAISLRTPTNDKRAAAQALPQPAPRTASAPPPATDVSVDTFGQPPAPKEHDATAGSPAEAEVTRRTSEGKAKAVALRMVEIDTKGRRARFTMSNGQVWVQRNNLPTGYRLPRSIPEGGIPVEIKRAALGSYMMNIDGKRGGIRVSRVDDE